MHRAARGAASGVDAARPAGIEHRLATPGLSRRSGCRRQGSPARRPPIARSSGGRTDPPPRSSITLQSRGEPRAEARAGDPAADDQDVKMSAIDGARLRFGKPRRLEVASMINAGFTEMLLGLLAILLLVAAVIDVRTFTISNGLNLAVALLAPLYWWSIGLPLVARRGDPASRVAAVVFAAARRRFLRGHDGRRRRQARGGAGAVVLACVDAQIPGPDVDRRRRPDAGRRRRCTACAKSQDARRFHTASQSHSAVSRFSPNGFLTNLPDV